MRASRSLMALVVCAGVLTPRDGRAQAWPAPAGAGSITLSTQAIDNTGHFVTGGDLLSDGKSRNVSAVVDVDYALTDRLAFSIGLPYVFARYIGPGPTPTPVQSPLDACRCWNSAWQDVSATARYNVVSGMVALTPSIAVGAPSHDYEWQGEAVVGYGLRELRLAIDGGVRLDALSTRLALISRYQYAFVEDVATLPEVANNRSNTSMTASYVVSERLSVRGGVSWQRTHGGLRYGSPLAGADVPPPGDATTDERVKQHDRLLRNNYWHLGAGATYSLPRLDVFASYLHFLRGSDTHAGRALTLGVSVPFQR
jgi:hypothetical protein